MALALGASLLIITIILLLTYSPKFRVAVRHMIRVVGHVIDTLLVTILIVAVSTAITGIHVESQKVSRASTMQQGVAPLT
jgi:hypothetical protein